VSEKKLIGRNVAIALGIICIILAVGLVGAISNYTSIISGKDDTIASLNSQIADKDSQIASKDSQISSLNTQIQTLTNQKNQLQTWLNSLNATYTWLKQHSFTYYTVGDAINISNVGIFSEWLDYWTINGTITNISDKPIETVYVYLILRNPDGTAEFESYNYVKIEDLYIGETAVFEFSYIVYDESQTVEIFLIY